MADGIFARDNHFGELIMKRFFTAIVFSAVLFSFAGCANRPVAEPDTITQVSTIDAILAGNYDGQMTLDELSQYGNFGIGTYHALDGEMILAGDKEFYQVKADGTILKASLDALTPFAVVSEFFPEIVLSIDEPCGIDRVKTLVDEAVSNPNIFIAIKITGDFRKMKTRSVPAQVKPYPPLAEVTKTQPEFSADNVAGTIVGFCCPPFVKGVNMPGYHLHFLANDRSIGGHVLDFTFSKGTIYADICHRFTMILPKDSKILGDADLSKDRSAELEKAEK